MSVDGFGEFVVPFTKFPDVVDDDRRMADDGLDGGLSFLCDLIASASVNGLNEN